MYTPKTETLETYVPSYEERRIWHEYEDYDYSQVPSYPDANTGEINLTSHMDETW